MNSFWEKYFKRDQIKLGPTALWICLVLTAEFLLLKGVTLLAFMGFSTFIIFRFQKIDRSKWFQEKWLAPTISLALSLLFYDLWQSYHSNGSEKDFAVFIQLFVGIFYPALFWLLIRLTQRHKEAESESQEIRHSLEKSEMHFQNMLNSMPLGIFKTKPDGSWVFVNEEWSNLSGQDFVAAHENGWKNAIEPADLENLNRELEIAQFRRMGFSLDVRLATTSHILTWVNFTVKPLTSNEGTFEGFIGTLENRTEKKRIEALLKTSQKIDRFLSADPSYLEIMKRSLGIIGQSFDVQFAAFWDIDTQEQKLRLSEYWHPQVSAPKEFIKTSKQLLLECGECFPGRVWKARTPVLVNDIAAEQEFSRSSVAQINGLHGAIAMPIIIDKHFLGVMEFFSKYKMVFSKADIEEFNGFATRIGQVFIKKKAEDELRHVRQYIEQQTSAINTFAIISIADTDGTITYVNENFVKVSKFEREEILGRDHSILSSGFHNKDFFTDLWKTLNRGESWKGEICNKAKDGTIFWLESTIVPFVNTEGITTQFVAIYSNVTDRKLTERKLLESAKMSSLGEMAGGIAHEINNPLTIIAGMAETISRTLKRQPLDMMRLEKASQRIETTVERVSKIVKGLKTFARDGSRDDFESYSVAQLLNETVDFCGIRFSECGIELHIEFPPNELKFNCRPIEIEQVLLNLLNNAFDAISDLKEKWISITTEVDEINNTLRLRIVDSGNGIPVAVQEKLFTPFFTTKDVGKGTGLGLSISQGIISQHSGSIYVDNSHPNTCFVLEFDLTAHKQLKEAS